MTRQELIEYYSRFGNWIVEDFKYFLEQRDKYLKSKRDEDLVMLQIAYDRIYTSNKRLWVEHKITEQRFWQLRDILQNDFLAEV